MPKRVFYSFHYVPDNWRVSQVRNIGFIEGNTAATDNDWESVTKSGDEAIKRWINRQMDGRSCSVVLIGSQTAGRKWIDYEIVESWRRGMGVLGIYIHNLKDRHGYHTTKGGNPFAAFNINGVSFANIVRAYEPPYNDSRQVYAHVSQNLASWIDSAILIRKRY